MKKLMFALLLVMLISQFAVPVALAADEPAGNCPSGFERAMAMDHDEHHQQHVGTDADRNGDGWICMKHVRPEIHLHIDNNLP